jgi:hypothetical protein
MNNIINYTKPLLATSSLFLHIWSPGYENNNEFSFYTQKAVKTILMLGQVFMMNTIELQAFTHIFTIGVYCDQFEPEKIKDIVILTALITLECHALQFKMAQITIKLFLVMFTVHENRKKIGEYGDHINMTNNTFQILNTAIGCVQIVSSIFQATTIYMTPKISTPVKNLTSLKSYFESAKTTTKTQNPYLPHILSCITGIIQSAHCLFDLPPCQET